MSEINDVYPLKWKQLICCEHTDQVILLVRFTFADQLSACVNVAPQVPKYDTTDLAIVEIE
jgi:hypothetical protein